MKNISQEDYLSSIYKYRRENGGIKATVLATRLQVSPAAVTDMLKKLQTDGFVNYARYKEITLTPNGEEYARKMVRRHRIWEMFLHKIVKMPWDKVHEEAERLEHSCSDELIDRLEDMLNFPLFDPHGDPIPQKDGKDAKHLAVIAVSLLQVKESGIIRRVNDHSPEFLQYLTTIGISLGTTIKIVQRREFDNSLVVSIQGKEVTISGMVASNMFAEKKR